jgi:hypothetical protein
LVIGDWEKRRSAVLVLLVPDLLVRVGAERLTVHGHSSSHHPSPILQFPVCGAIFCFLLCGIVLLAVVGWLSSP